MLRVVVVDLNGCFFLQVDGHLNVSFAVSGVVVVCVRVVLSVPSLPGGAHTISYLLGISRDFPVFLGIPRPLYIYLYILYKNEIKLTKMNKQ